MTTKDNNQQTTQEQYNKKFGRFYACDGTKEYTPTQFSCNKSEDFKCKFIWTKSESKGLSNCQNCFLRDKDSLCDKFACVNRSGRFHAVEFEQYTEENAEELYLLKQNSSN